jgi:hypothetical protein
MRKSIKIFLIAVSIIIILLLIYFVLITFFSSPVNNFLNRLVAGVPDTNCNVDSDCAIKITSCFPCDCGSFEAVNKDWKAFCPLKYPFIMLCKPCQGYDAKCLENKCIKIIKT